MSPGRLFNKLDCDFSIRHDWFNAQLRTARLNANYVYILYQTGWLEAVDWLGASSITILRFFLVSQDDSSRTLQRVKLCCVYIKLFYKLVDVFSLFLMQMDWLLLEPKRRQALFCSLMLFQLLVCCTKEAAWWHDECTALFCLCCCLCLSLIKGSGPDDARGEGSGSAAWAEKHQQRVIL